MSPALFTAASAAADTLSAVILSVSIYPRVLNNVPTFNSFSGSRDLFILVLIVSGISDKDCVN